MIAVIVDMIAIRSQTPSGEGGSGLLRFLLWRVALCMVDGRKTSPLAVVCICWFIVFVVELVIVRAFWWAFKDGLGERFNLGVGQVDFLP